MPSFKRAALGDQYRRVYDEAHAEGLAAIGEATASDYEMGNVGWAWVRIRPGNKGFASWLRRQGLASSAHGGGVRVNPPPVHATTNLDPQARYCRAFADVVNAAEVLDPGGVCSAEARLDGDC